MEIGLSLPIKMSSTKKSDYVKRVKDLGVSSVWVGDNPPINNAFLDIGRLIGSIKNIDFWTGITSPFYYSLEVLFSLSVWLNTNFPGRFGLGLGVGNPEIIKDKEIIKKPFSSFTQEIDKLLNLIKIRYYQQNKDDFPPIAIGGLGDRMINYSQKTGSFLLLNSGSIYDINRALDSLNITDTELEHNLIPYSMLQTVDKQDSISLTLWNIVKDIAKGCSKEILQKHEYSSKEISLIRKLSWERATKPPPKKFQFLAKDFALYGSIESIFEKLKVFKKLEEKNRINKLVLGWIHEEQKWEDLKEIINFLK